ncbi:protein phosphatase 1 regulatory subunit 21-like [Microtus pennsylvanicus]|uniref:protein phosphatase 1 regulatory subunit 21-like n=1 Tax=Microtus pennsylvanicus TaxID=10058 RepID=UPI003F6A9A8A
MSQRSTVVLTLDADCGIVQSSQVMWSTSVFTSREMTKCGVFTTEFYEAIRMIYCLQENGYNQRLSCEVDQVPDVESREDLIKNHYMARIAELTSQLQLSDSKSVHFYTECRALLKRLALAEKCKEMLTEEVKLASQNSSRLQVEVTLTSMMSDHLCSMNETLSKQREEIDTLKMSSKVCAGRGVGMVDAAGRRHVTVVFQKQGIAVDSVSRGASVRASL